MKITFNLQGTGAGDNGGTATIFHSANMLHKLGHAVNIVSFGKNEFTWFKLDGPTYVITKRYDYPDADLLIATGVSSVKHVLDSSANKGAKVWWIRAHETWAASQDQLFAMYRNANMSLLVNSVCLEKFILKNIGRRAVVVRPGMDHDLFFPERERLWHRKKTFVLGALYNEKPRKRFKWVPEIYEQLVEKGFNVHLDLFGTYDKPSGFPYRNYAKKPAPAALRKFYNKVDIWLAPTKSEGLHMPPQEAMLCECVVVGANAQLSGMADYLDHGSTGIVVPDWPEAVDSIVRLFEEEEKTSLATLSRNGRNKIISLGTREENMKYMLTILERILDRTRHLARSMRHRR